MKMWIIYREIFLKEKGEGMWLKKGLNLMYDGG